MVNAIVVWTRARAERGTVRLRIEDHDCERSRPEFEASILDDLEWLAFVPDLPGLEAFRHGACDGRQSDHPERYDSALTTLARRGLVYCCACSRADIARRSGETAAAGAKAPDTERRYDGYCRDRRVPPRPGVGVRVRIEPGIERFDDVALGWQEQDPHEQCGDVLVRDRIGLWTYQFAVTVDDLVEGITDVIRGRDLLASTGRQIRLARLLGRSNPPRFHHHPLILDDGGQKLSKARGDTGIRELRREGLNPSDVIERARRLAGLPA